MICWPESSRSSHTLASRQSRMTLLLRHLQSLCVSATLRPPEENRSSITCAFLASDGGERIFFVVERDQIPAFRLIANSRPSSRGMRSTAPPRLS